MAIWQPDVASLQQWRIGRGLVCEFLIQIPHKGRKRDPLPTPNSRRDLAILRCARSCPAVPGRARPCPALRRNRSRFPPPTSRAGHQDGVRLVKEPNSLKLLLSVAILCPSMAHLMPQHGHLMPQHGPSYAPSWPISCPSMAVLCPSMAIWQPDGTRLHPDGTQRAPNVASL